jgi:drug/metabolite transporter (DMT)-like permease
MNGRGNTNVNATLAGLGAIVLWSTSVALARSIAETLGPLLAGAAVYGLGGAALVIWRLVGRPGTVAAKQRLPRAYLVGCGLLFVLYSVVFFLALGLAKDATQALVVGLVNYLWPALTVMLSVPILKARAGWFLVPATVAAVTGVALVLTSGQSVTWDSLAAAVSDNRPAFACALVAAVSWALYSNLARCWGGASPAGAVPYFVLASGVALWLLQSVGGQAAAWNLRVALEVCFMALTVAISYVCWDKAMRQGDIQLVSACSYLTPLLSTLASCSYLHVSPSPRLWLGCLALVTGSFMSWRSVRAPTA